MGATFNIHCQNCDYQAEVSGGEDVGFVIKTRTIYCSTCRELRDVTIEYWCKDLMTPAEAASLNDDDLGRCQQCRARVGQTWSLGDPCPRCGGNVKHQFVFGWD